MSRKIIIVSIIFALFFAVGFGIYSPSFAFYNPFYYSPRSTAMGGAFVAVADDANAVFYNSAGLGFIEKNNLSINYGIPFKDINYYMFNGNLSLNEFGVIGFGANTHIFDATVRDLDGNTETLSISFGEQRIGYGYKLNNLISLGISGSRIFQDFDGGAAGEVHGINLGLLFKPTDKFSIGILSDNVNKPKLVSKFGIENTMQMDAALGLSYRTLNDNLLLAFDLINQNIEKNGDIDAYSIGSELNILEILKLRFGCKFDRNYDSNSSSYYYAGTGSAGLGFHFFENLQFDYAWVRPNRIIYDSHYFSLGCKF